MRGSKVFMNRSEMSTAVRLPWDEAWGRERPPWKLTAVVLFLLVMSVGFVPFSIDAARRGDTLTELFGVVGIGFGLTFMVGLAPLLRVRRTTLPRTMNVGVSSEGAPGLSLPYLRSWRISLSLWLVFGAIFLGIRGLMFASRLSGSGDSGARSAITTSGLIIVVVVVAMIAALLWYLLSSRRRRSFVSLSEFGVTQRMGRTVRVVAWSDIADVSARTENNSRMVRIVPIAGVKVGVDTGGSLLDRLQRGWLESSIDVPVWVLGMDPALFLHLVRFYWQHPEARDELTSDAVIDRMRQGELLN